MVSLESGPTRDDFRTTHAGLPQPKRARRLPYSPRQEATDMAKDFQHLRSAAARTRSPPKPWHDLRSNSSRGMRCALAPKTCRHLEYWPGSHQAKPRWCTAWGQRGFRTAITAFFCFRVPELTRSAGIQLNKRVSLRRRPERIDSRQPDNFPASGPSVAKPSGVILRLAALF
jgi:hypothetical protein